MKLKEKSAIVTGAASGIGNEIALVYAREGAQAAIADPNQAAAATVASEIRASGGQAIAIAMDVTDEKAVNEGVQKGVEAFEKGVEAFGAVDILVSNARIQIVHPRSSASRVEEDGSRSMSMARSSPRARASRTCTRRDAAAASSTWAPCIPRRRRCSRRPT
jgi:NAD(P)-dependent dehydrogenase (short-subunit alcohol dehydrogenase family)